MTCGTRKVFSPGFCGNVAPATPCAVPATCETLCPEDHTQQIVVQKFNATLIIRNSWNIPACEESITVIIEGLTNIQVGSFLWSQAYGYFKVISFNLDTSEVTLENLCNSGNAAVGTQVPECSDFVVTDPPSSAASNNTQGFPYVASNFTAQNVGDCIDIEVTTTNGLISGAIVQISDGEYRISAIPDANSVTICNDGDGITPGTVVVAQNGAGEYQYPITLVSVSPCAAGSANSGSLVICSAGQNKTLGALQLGQVPVVTDASNSIVEFQNLTVQELTCTLLGANFIVVSGTNSYIITLTSTASFLAGDTLIIGSRTERFGLNLIIDGTHAQVTMYPTPSANATINAGTQVCIALDCEDTQFPNIVEAGIFGSLGTVTLNSGTTSYTSGGGSVSLANTSKCRTMSFGLGIVAIIVATISGSTTNPFNFNAILFSKVDALATVPIGSILRYYNYAANTAAAISEEVGVAGPLYSTYPTRLTLAPQTSATVTFNLTLGISGTIGAAVYSVTSIGASYTIYGLTG